MKAPEALQETLAAEHAAVYVYSLVGAKSLVASPVLGERLQSAYATHRARRDHLRSRIASAGAVPVGAAPAYEVDAEDVSVENLQRVARETEARCAAVYAQLVASSTGETRRWAVDALVDSAVRSLTLGSAANAYPGLTELG